MNFKYINNYMKTYILSDSKKKGKRYKIDMGDHSHDFGSDVGKTFIDHNDTKKKLAWKARHSPNKNYNSKHSAIYHSKELLWTKPTLAQSIRAYEAKHKVKIINKVK